VQRQLRLADPLIDLRLFCVPAFSGSIAAYGLGILVLFGGFLFLPQYLQLVLGLSPLLRRPVVAAVGLCVHRRV
jgi:DHA2 family multidrug resistance protein-like MFS transporter